MINKQSNSQIIKKIINSSEFRDSAIYKNLLTYIFESNEKKIIPKEASIAIDVFNKNLSEATEKQSIARVYIHNLRKKLDSYYRNEGKNDLIKIDIPKGKYNIEYHTEKHQLKVKNIILYILIFTVLALGFSTIYLFNKELVQNSGSHINHSKIWRDFKRSEKSTILIVGDYYLYIDTSMTKLPCLIRDFGINSEKDLDDFLSLNKDKSKGISKTHHTFLTKLAPLGVSKILPFFIKNNIPIQVKLSSNIEWTDLKDNNIIYIGSYKTLNKLQNEFDKLDFKYSIENSSLTICDSAFYRKKFITSQNIHQGIMKDYAVFAKIKGENNNNILFFISTHDIGNLGIIDRFTNSETIKQFEKLNIDDTHNDYFESLFKVEGFEKTDFNSKLMFFKKLSY